MPYKDPEVAKAKMAERSKRAEEKRRRRMEEDPEFYAKRREKMRSYMRAYRARNLEQVRKYEREYAKATGKGRKRWETVKADPELIERQRAQVRRSYQKHRAKRLAGNRDYRLRTNFGITSDDYNQMLAAQNGACAICKNTKNKHNTGNNSLDVDHCHDTKAIRGLLCNFCNTGIGNFKNDPDLLRTAAAYLERPPILTPSS